MTTKTKAADDVDQVDQAPAGDAPVDPRDVELEQMRAELIRLREAETPTDPRDVEIRALKQLLAEAVAKAAAPAVTTDVVERLPYLVGLACGHSDRVDNAASATHHHCRECDATMPVTGVVVLPA